MKHSHFLKIIMNAITCELMKRISYLCLLKIFEEVVLPQPIQLSKSFLDEDEPIFSTNTTLVSEIVVSLSVIFSFQEHQTASVQETLLY
jgi:hypothetical protein